MPGWVFQQSHIHNVATGQEIGEPCRQTRLKAVLGTERFGATGEEDYQFCLFGFFRIAIYLKNLKNYKEIKSHTGLVTVTKSNCSKNIVNFPCAICAINKANTDVFKICRLVFTSPDTYLCFQCLIHSHHHFLGSNFSPQLHNKKKNSIARIQLWHIWKVFFKMSMGRDAIFRQPNIFFKDLSAKYNPSSHGF